MSRISTGLFLRISFSIVFSLIYWSYWFRRYHLYSLELRANFPTPHLRTTTITIPGLSTTFSWVTDLEDTQWRDFRSELVPLTTAFLSYILLFRLIYWLLRLSRDPEVDDDDLPSPWCSICCNSSFPSLSSTHRRRIGLFLRFVVGFLFLIALHGLEHTFLLLLFLFLPVLLFSLSLHHYPRLFRILLWTWSLLLIIAVPLAQEHLREKLFGWPGGIVRLRFWVHLNLGVLRMISIGETWIREAEKEQEDTLLLDLNGAEHWCSSMSSVSGFIERVLLWGSLVSYPLLYVAGPIVTYSNFQFFLLKKEEEEQQQQKKIKKRKTNSIPLYFLRTLFAFLFLELYLSLLHIPSLIKKGYVRHMTPSSQIYFSLFALGFIYLKFNAIWKFFRLFTLIDGCYVEENLTRCIFAYRGIRQFWQGWHVSFRYWLIQYIYIPLGGKNQKIVSSILVFLFVGLWHEGLEIRLLAWGAIAGLFFASEELWMRWLERSEENEMWNWWWREVRCCVTGMVLVPCMNIGFVGWKEGLSVWKGYFTTMDGWGQMVITFGYSFSLGNLTDLVRSYASEPKKERKETDGVWEL